MLEIARREDEKGVYQKEIAVNQNISFKYLDHIIAGLKSAGLIMNVRGKKSGYTLTRSPEDISILDIVKAFEPEICIVECISDLVHCEAEDTCATKLLWEGLNEQIIQYLKNYSLGKLVEDQNSLLEKKENLQ
jgi:Rrf2 family protein